VVERGVFLNLTGDPVRVVLRCSINDWARVFGEVRIVAVQYGPGGHPAFQAWEYECTDGSVLCVGCEYERRFDGENRVMVRALCFS
jgi:hypothetical protein